LDVDETDSRDNISVDNEIDSDEENHDDEILHLLM